MESEATLGTPDRAARFAVAGSAAVALSVRLVAARRVPVGYDGFWHLFAARNLAREVSNVAHRPLYLLLLAACDRIASRPLAYRAVSIAAGARAADGFPRRLVVEGDDTLVELCPGVGPGGA